MIKTEKIAKDNTINYIIFPIKCKYICKIIIMLYDGFMRDVTYYSYKNRKTFLNKKSPRRLERREKSSRVI